MSLIGGCCFHGRYEGGTDPAQRSHGGHATAQRRKQYFEAYVYKLTSDMSLIVCFSNNTQQH